MTEQITKTRAEASRENGAKSHGPATPAGRAISSQNARKHGILMNPTLFQGEDLVLYHDLLDALTAELAPEGPLETRYVRDMALAEFRLERIVERQEQLLAGDLNENRQALALLLRYETSSRRTFDRANADLQKLRKSRPQTPQAKTVVDYSHYDNVMAARIPDELYRKMMSSPPCKPTADVDDFPELADIADLIKSLRNEPENDSAQA